MTEAEVLSFQTKDWRPIPRLSRTIPFGYRVDENDPDLLQPVILELEALELAKKHVKSFSYRAVAEWIAATTGRTISHVGLKKRLDIERKRGRKAEALKTWASRYQEAIEKAQKYQSGSLGAKGDGTPEETGSPVGSPEGGDQS